MGVNPSSNLVNHVVNPHETAHGFATASTVPQSHGMPSGHTVGIVHIACPRALPTPHRSANGFNDAAPTAGSYGFAKPANPVAHSPHLLQPEQRHTYPQCPSYQPPGTPRTHPVHYIGVPHSNPATHTVSIANEISSIARNKVSYTHV